jgi:hypothetical protein
MSLICRCCRAPVCEQNLTKADRMRVRRELWRNDSRTRQNIAPESRRRPIRSLLSRFAPRTFKRIARATLRKVGAAIEPSIHRSD